ncbi:unnamed protein product [Caenorhabditis auriculariae]|uniref:C-type lectin domain-containing protein n=1 Tax=Caenorhabditis auriculariae TaxID=2777116 RepID=A0A8S1HUZ4_9PELO|nr:unnamed protein product [Caenorhabditis auriculariae]
MWSVTIVFLLWAFCHDSYSDEQCDALVQSSGTPFGRIGNKCVYLSKNPASGSLTTTCKNVLSKDTNNPLSQLSIDNDGENEQVKEWLLDADTKEAFIGLASDGSSWSWMNGDTSGYNQFADPTLRTTKAPPVTNPPPRTTLPPSQQRKSVAIVIAVDASIYSTNSWTYAQTNFAKSLGDYITARGPAQFAIFPYGCTKNPGGTLLQYPVYTSTYEGMLGMVANMNETITHDCTRTNPLDFLSMYLNMPQVYYNRFPNSIRPFTASYLSLIMFSANTDPTVVKQLNSYQPMAQSSVITVSVGTNANSLTRLSIPANVNFRRVTTAEEIIDLVPVVDSIIFGTDGASNFAQRPLFGFGNDQLIVDASNYVDCAFMNSSDGLWYSDSCKNKRQILCQSVIPTPPPPPTPNPTIEWSDPCSLKGTFSYFQDLGNAKCYRVSTAKKQFAEAETTCITDHPLFLHEPVLTSVQTEKELTKIDTLVSGIQNEGMFWFGLRRNSTSSWYFVNGDPYDPSMYSNWREGYPRQADGCDCVAYVLNDKKWINTDCNLKLFAVCAYRYNTSSAF